MDLLPQLVRQAQLHGDHELAQVLNLHMGHAQLSTEGLALLFRSLHSPQSTVVALALKILTEASKATPRLILNIQSIEYTLVWMLDHSLQGSGHGLVAAVLEIFSCILADQCGTVEATGCGKLKGILSEPVIRAICRVLSRVVDRCSLADVELGCSAARAIILAMGSEVRDVALPSLLEILAQERLLKLILGMTRVAYQLPRLVLLQACNDLLGSYCQADNDQQEQLCAVVFDAEIEFSEKDSQSREAVVEFLFWINALTFSIQRVVCAMRSLVWIGRYRILERLNLYLQRIWCEEDHDWFLVCANTYSSAFNRILSKLESSPVPEGLVSSFQTELLESGLLDNTHRFVKGLASMLMWKAAGGGKSNDPMMTPNYMQGVSTVALVTSNVYQFYTLCMDGNTKVCQYCEVCDPFESILETLGALGELLKTCSDSQALHTCSEAEERVLGVLCLLMRQKVTHNNAEQWPTDAAHIQNGVLLQVVDLIGEVRLQALVPPARRIGIMRKSMELLHSTMQYASEVVSRYSPEVHAKICQHATQAMSMLKPQLDSLGQVQVNRCKSTAASVLDEIDSYLALLETKLQT